jgi:hypothetical protein
MKRKCLVIGIVFLFIGVSFAPTISQSVVTAYQDDYVEVATQACGINGYKNTTVKLTREQYQDLEQYLVGFRARLNQTSTREEAVPIFKDAVVELDKYGLLPKGMSVEKAQKLVIGFNQNIKLIEYLEKLLHKSESLQDGNANCLLFGKSQGFITFQGPILRLIYMIFIALMEISDFIMETYFNHIGFFWLMLFIFYSLYPVPADISETLSFLFIDSPYIGSIIYNGEVAGYGAQEPDYYPDRGSIWTNGVNGIKNWSGQFYGQLASYPLCSHDETLGYWTCYPGINGFTGLRLYFNHTVYYFGFALNVNVGPNPPY